MKNLFIVTGEHSGDLHASYVVKELKKIIPDVCIEAVGGENLESVGVKLFHDHSTMGVVGLSLNSIISHFELGKNILTYLKNIYKPDLVLLIDYGGFNLRLAKALKSEGIKVFYYISPQVWATRKGRLNIIKKYVDKMMLILPFEEKIHKTAGVNAEYVGHPLSSQLPQKFDKEEFIKQNELDPLKRIVGIFPGSRKMEINNLFPIFLQAARIVFQNSKKVQFCIGQAPNVKDDMIIKFLKKYNKDNELNIKIIKNQNHALLANSDVVMLASGTITLEAAIYEAPMIVSYKGPYLLYLIYLMIRYLKFVSLPNIIAGKQVVEEFIQDRAKADLIAKEVLSLLDDQTKREEMIINFKIIKEKLGDKVASIEVAEIIGDYLNGKRISR